MPIQNVLCRSASLAFVAFMAVVFPQPLLAQAEQAQEETTEVEEGLYVNPAWLIEDDEDAEGEEEVGDDVAEEAGDIEGGLYVNPAWLTNPEREPGDQTTVEDDAPVEELAENESGLYVNPEWFGMQSTEDRSADEQAAGADEDAGEGTTLYQNPEWFAGESEQPTDEAGTASTAPSYGQSLSERLSQPQAPGEMSADLIEFVWRMIDRDDDNLATDREEYRAIRPARVFSNYIEKEDEVDELAALRRESLQLFDFDHSGQLERGEAAYMLALVRGLRCPYAERAEQFWSSLDSNGNGLLEPAEFVARLQPLGNVGIVMAQPLSRLLHNIDVDGDDVISREEVYFSANAMLRVQLATDGAGGRDPADWVRFVSIIAGMDIDCDNGVVPFEAARAGMSGQMFSQIDSNGDYRITPSEMCDMQDRLDAQARAVMEALANARRSSTSGSAGGFC